jgi:hypothetical protein
MEGLQMKRKANQKKAAEAEHVCFRSCSLFTSSVCSRKVARKEKRGGEGKKDFVDEHRKRMNNDPIK